MRAAALALALLWLAAAARARAEEAGFDYFTLALSWSPSYCAEEGPDAGPMQCGRAHAYGFVVHGLWPERTGRSDFACDTHGAPWLDEAVIAEMLDIMPSRGLVIHEWKKHGWCTGHSPQRYFASVRKAFARVAIPAALQRLSEPITVAPETLRKAFVRMNDDIPPDGIYVRCRERRVVEVRLCLTRGLDYRACPDVEARRCRADMLEMPAMRGAR